MQHFDSETTLTKVYIGSFVRVVTVIILHYVLLVSFAMKPRSFLIRVATAQGKQGIWLLTFPDREKSGNLVNLIFYTGKIVATQGKF